MTESQINASTAPIRSEEEQARILLAAKEAKNTVILVAALAIGSMIFMFLITLVVIALNIH
jgi:hypothetical protein